MSLPELPPLPEPVITHGLARLFGKPEFNADEMHAYAKAYALACVEAERERCAQIAENTLEDVGRSSIYGTESAAAIRAQGKTE